MAEQTSDPNVEIVERRGDDYIHYRRHDTGKEWIVRGVCNQCGLCVIGAANADHYEWVDEPGRPGAVRDVRFPLRPDEPVMPGFNEACARMAAECETATVSGCSLSVGSYF